MTQLEDGIDDLLARNAQREETPAHLSHYFRVEDTQTTGRAAFANESIPAGTDIFRCSAPFVHVIYKQFRKEVCATCFRYDGGRKMKVGYMAGDGKEYRGLAWFCSIACKTQWEARMGEAGVEAVLAIHSALARVKKAASVGDARTKPITESEIEIAWQRAAASTPANDIRLIDEEDNEDTLLFLLDGILARAREPEKWHALLSLNPTLAPYYSDPSLLASHIRIYDFLRVHLPRGSRPHAVPSTLLALITREAGNSFGIWEQDVEDDGEMLGYGTWIESSFFNHSCEPNLKKRIDGPVFDFYTLSDVDAGQDLCINYIGDAREAPVKERQAILQKGWGFFCGCRKCARDL